MSKNEKREFKKEDPTIFNPNELYGSILELPVELKAELDKKGLVARWINATEMQRQYGFNKSGWRPYKPDMKLSITNGMLGDAEGYIRRGDLVLATKTKDEHTLHKKKLEFKASIYKGYNKQKAEELRSFMRGAGVKTKVVEGYDEPGDKEDDE
jgi:hypothetical protein